MAQWLIHLDNGITLTDQDCYPHNINTLGYSDENITSVERVINGRHMTIKKSPYTSMFFVATEESVDMAFSAIKQKPPQVTKRMLGCHLVDSDPPVQVRLVMDPRNYNVSIKFHEVKKPTKKGINARFLNPPPKGSIQAAYQKEVIDNVYTIIQSDVIKSVHGTPYGMAAILKNPKIRAELIIRSQNVLLRFTQKGQKLQIT